MVLCKPHRWHVQVAGEGEAILLLHGAGGATQSWRHLFPLLAQTHRVLAIDLPGQGFTELGAKARCGLRHMAEDVTALLDHRGFSPKAIIGHSAPVQFSGCGGLAFSDDGQSACDQPDFGAPLCQDGDAIVHSQSHQRDGLVPKPGG